MKETQIANKIGKVRDLTSHAIEQLLFRPPIREGVKALLMATVAAKAMNILTGERTQKLFTDLGLSEGLTPDEITELREEGARLVRGE